MELFDPLTAPKSCEHVFVEDATVPVVHLSPKIHSIGVRIFAPVDLPTKKHLRPLLLWCHGGGYAIGSPFASTTDAACRNLAKMADVIIMSIDYRRCPENKFPSQIEDLWGVLLWIQQKQHPIFQQVDFAKLIIGGDSSGGNLSAVMCILANERRWSYKFLHQLLVYPWFPRTELTESQKQHGYNGYMLTNEHSLSFLEKYLPLPELLQSYYVNPLLTPKHLLAHVPPAHIITAGLDPIQDDGIEYGKLLRQVGVKVTQTHIENTAHGFFTLLFLPEAKEAHMRVAEVLQAQFA